MIAIAFILFALLIVAWLMAPTGDKVAKPAKTVLPQLVANEAGAD